MREAERGGQWRRIRSGAVQVIVGARSAVFAPMQNVGLIIVDEEHEGSYQSETVPFSWMKSVTNGVEATPVRRFVVSTPSR